MKKKKTFNKATKKVLAIGTLTDEDIRRAVNVLEKQKSSTIISLKEAYEMVIKDLHGSTNRCSDDASEEGCFSCRCTKAEKVLEEIMEMGFHE